MRMNRFKKFIARFLIPDGFYCYTRVKDKYVACPFYSKKSERHHQENGYCSYLEKGDWDINESYPSLLEIQQRQEDGTMKNVMIPREKFFPLSLLWDGVKECSVKFNTKGYFGEKEKT
jgi:hypothetical protein